MGYTDKLTYDHVIPRSRWVKNNYNGTATSWTNIVTCCSSCNRRKGDKSLKEAGMKLMREPVEPNPHQYILGISPWNIRKIPKEWYDYLTPLYKNLLEEETHV